MKCLTEKALNRSIPINFEIVENIDDRFTAVKIWLMHTGENLNSSVFTKEVVEGAIPSLGNTPILGYIEERDGETDYSDHRFAIEVKNGSYSWKYLGSAYGVIPEKNNARWEIKKCSDGIEREFLVCDGLMWNKFTEATDIMNSDMQKFQSMELHDDYSGTFDNEGKFHFSNFKFFGACILGHGVEPGMNDASIEVITQFSLSQAKNQITKYLKEFELICNSRNVEGGEKMNEDSNKKDTGNGSEINLENYENKDKEDVSKNTNIKNNFDISSNVSLWELKNLLKLALQKDGYSVDEWGWSTWNYYFVDVQGSVVIAESAVDAMFCAFDYTLDGDVPIIDWNSKRFVVAEWRDLVGDTSSITIDFSIAAGERVNYIKGEVKSMLEKHEKESKDTFEKIETLEKTVYELKEFKDSKLKEERVNAIEALFSDSKFSHIEPEQLSEFKEKSLESDMSIENIETALFAMLGKKVAGQFSKKNDDKDKGDNQARIVFAKEAKEEDVAKKVKSYSHLMDD